MDAVMKGLVLAIGIFAVSIWRSIANLILTSALYLPGRPRWPKPATLRIHVGRGIVVMVMAGLFFCRIGRVPPAQALALTFTAPLLSLLLARLLLHDRVRR